MRHRLDRRDATDFIGEDVAVTIDRPLGSKHPRGDLIYPVNYGFIPGTLAGDGEPIDAYVLGVATPRQQFDGTCIAVLVRAEEDDPKLVAVPRGVQVSDAAILAATHFQEQFFETTVVRQPRAQGTPLRHESAAVAAEIQHVMHAAYSIEAELLGVDDFPPLRRSAAEIAVSESRFIGVHVAVGAARRLVAVAEVEQSCDEPSVTNLAALVVLPEYFRQGFATQLIHRVVRDAASDVTVSTGVANQPALRLYAKLAFHEEQRWATECGISMVTLRRGANRGGDHGRVQHGSS
ncbi:MAG: GNAT family N-acetyltransferase [Planctomycetota bacterium]